MAAGFMAGPAKLRAQRKALSEFGKHALKSQDLQELLQRATELVSEAADCDLVKVLELLPDGEEVLVRAGVGWKPGVVGNATFGAHERSPAGYAMQTDEPVISRDVATETRFEIPELLKEHQIVSMVNVVIRTELGPWGVLEVDSREHRDFDDDDSSFLQNYANVLAAAVERLNSHHKLERAGETREVLMGELQHRVRNMLGNIRVLAKRTRRSSSDLDDFLARFDQRLSALARAQDMLTVGPDKEVAVRDLLIRELDAHGFQLGPSVSIAGPNVTLPPDPAQALAIAFHELTTNAIKHGGLDGGGGQLDVSWSVEPTEAERERLLIRWREAGVPIEKPPSRKGYGSEVVLSSLPYMLGGGSKLEFHRDGAECNIWLPLEQANHSSGKSAR